MSVKYGIDFGTSNTVVAYGERENNILQVNGSNIIPSLLFVDRYGHIAIGNSAKDDYARALQTYHRDPYLYFRYVQGLKMALRDPGLKTINLFIDAITVEDLIGMFLRSLKQQIEAITNDPADEVVVGWPADLDQQTNQVIMERFTRACQYAGYRQVHYVYEPVAALIDSMHDRQGTCLIFDFGGGTLDITVADVHRKTVNVRTIAGRNLGGYLLSEDISNARIIRHFGHGSCYKGSRGDLLVLPYYLTGQVSSFYALPLQNIADIKSVIARFLNMACDKARIRGLFEFVNRGLFQQLYQQIDQAKVDLSTHDSATIRFAVPPYIDFEETITRTEFEEIIHPRIEAIERMICEVLADIDMPATAIDFVVLVGGSTQIPAVQSLLQRIFPGRIHQGNTFASIAAGLLSAYRQGVGIAG